MEGSGKIKKILLSYFDTLLHYFGPRHWWPGETPFEVIIGAILTQNTTWKNVEKTITVLEQRGLIDPDKLRAVPEHELAQLIKSSGYFNQKAKKIRHFLEFFETSYHSDTLLMKKQELPALRKQLLAVNGIGPETADSILLYALSKPVFVVDAYTRRIFSRHHLISSTAPYDEIQTFFTTNLDQDLYLYNEYHALIVHTGKDFCRKIPRCEVCPLREFLPK